MEGNSAKKKQHNDSFRCFPVFQEASAWAERFLLVVDGTTFQTTNASKVMMRELEGLRGTNVRDAVSVVDVAGPRRSTQMLELSKRTRQLL